MTETLTINGIDFTVEYQGNIVYFSGGDIQGRGKLSSSPDGGISLAEYDLGTHAGDNSRDAVHQLITQLKKSFNLF